MFYFSLIFEILALHKLLLSRMTIGLAYQKVYSFKLDKVFFPHILIGKIEESTNGLLGSVSALMDFG